MAEQLDEVPALIQKAYDTLKTSDADAARSILDEALSKDYENQEILYALKCITWWTQRIERAQDFQDNYDRGGYLLSQWKPFYNFLDQIGEPNERCLYAIRRYIYSTVLIYFKDILGDKVNQYDPGLLLQVGRCYKGVGNYDSALFYLQQAVRFKREDGETLSELADVNALLGDVTAAKALFREAFFMDPQSVDLRAMESEMIIRLRDRVSALGIQGKELLEWIPIYGCLFGVLSVKRELRPTELGRLRQSIFSLENDIRSRPSNLSQLIPKLINRYFWLIDHYENTREAPALIEETMLKIKLLDPEIYKKFIR